MLFHGGTKYIPGWEHCALQVLTLSIGIYAMGCAGRNILAETPMNTTNCTQLPTVEECRTAAEVIDDDCLRECVMAQCAGVKVNCSEVASRKCAVRREQKGQAVGGFVDIEGQTCRIPKEEINWCQIPMSRPCRAKAMVHELAHSCGWLHRDGKNVPADNGSLQCK